MTGIELTKKSRARALIEDFMIAANGAMARFLDGRGVASIRRVVKAPERWQRIVTLARECGDALPAEPSSRALSEFLDRRKQAAPDTFADLSLSVVKLMGPGEYALERPASRTTGTSVSRCSTTPTRRRRTAASPICVTQRLVKAALAHARCPVLGRGARAASPRTARRRRTTRARWSGRRASRRRRCSSATGSDRSSTRS